MHLPFSPGTVSPWARNSAPIYSKSVYVSFIDEHKVNVHPKVSVLASPICLGFLVRLFWFLGGYNLQRLPALKGRAAVLNGLTAAVEVVVGSFGLLMWFLLMDGPETRGQRADGVTALRVERDDALCDCTSWCMGAFVLDGWKCRHGSGSKTDGAIVF